MSMLRDDFDDVLDYCKATGKSFYDVELPSVVVSYGNPGGRTRIDELKRVVFVKRSHKAAQEVISYVLAQAGISRKKLSAQGYPPRKKLPIRQMSGVQAINAVNAAWNIKRLFFFSGGVFYWGEKPEQKQVYTFEYGINIIQLLYCADCGGKMYVHRTSNGKRIHQYTCGQYGREPVGTRCLTQHRIKESAVLDLISGMLRAIADYAKSDRAAFIREVQEAQASQQDSDIKKKKRRLAAAQKRAGELERLVCKIYEDNALGRLPDARYAALDAQYAKEQEELSAEIMESEKAVGSYDQGRKSAEKFIALHGKAGEAKKRVCPACLSCSQKKKALAFSRVGMYNLGSIHSYGGKEAVILRCP